jgi:hypothetical protein
MSRAGEKARLWIGRSRAVFCSLKTPAKRRRRGIFRQIEARKRRNNGFIASARNDELAENNRRPL